MQRQRSLPTKPVSGCSPRIDDRRAQEFAAITAEQSQRADERAEQAKLERQRDAVSKERYWLFQRADRVRQQLRDGWSFEDIARGGITLEQVKRIYAADIGAAVDE